MEDRVTELVSRRTAIVAGLTGLAAVSLGSWGAAAAQAEGVASASVDLAGLGDDELLKLESDVATEKAKRGINSAALPRGMYLVGTVLDAGSYSISPVLSEGESSYQIGVYESADTIKSEGTLFELSLYDGDSFVVALADNNILAVEGTCIISPFKVVFDGDSSNS